MLVSQSGGARGHVVDKASGRPVSEAKICHKEQPSVCSLTDANGGFKVEPIMHRKWELFMLEDFPYSYLGDFVVAAQGYEEKEITARFADPITVQLVPVK